MSKIYYSFVILSISIPNVVFGIESAAEAESSLENIAGFMQWILISLGVLFVIISAYKFLFAAGDPEKAKDAKKMLAYTLIAIIVALVAFGIPSLVENILTN